MAAGNSGSRGRICSSVGLLRFDTAKCVTPINCRGGSCCYYWRWSKIKAMCYFPACPPNGILGITLKVIPTAQASSLFQQ